MSKDVTFAMDKNLGFNVQDPKWQQFFKKFNVKPLIYDDMKEMTADMQKNTIGLAYFPAATFFYFKTDSFYTPIANALFTANQTSKISSLLVVSKHVPIDNLSQLKGKKLGYIHPYCTTSYFAPALLLWQHHYSIYHFFSQLKEVGAWQAQVDAVITGQVDATMIQEDIWYKLPKNAQETKIIAQEDDLPSPIIIAAKNLHEELKSNLQDLLFSYKPQPLPNSLFNKFIPFQRNQVEKFYSEATQAFSHQSK